MITLVAGATGMLGREIVRTLKTRGHRVRVLSRSAERARPLGADDVAVADAVESSSLDAAMTDVTRVVSALGAPVSMDFGARPGYLAIDVVGNSHLIDAAARQRVGRFVYVSVHGASGYEQTRYVRAHQLVEHRLRASGLSHAIVRPTGLFPVFDAFVDMARRGICSMPGAGSARTNPVDAADVAALCADMLASRMDTTASIGGPDVFTRRQIVAMAFQAVGRRPRIVHVPVGVFTAMGRVIHPLHPRMGELLDFAARAFSHDSVAPAIGARHLADHFAAVARR